MTKVYLGIDIGSSSTKCGAFGEQGEPLGSASRGYQPKLGHGGVAEYSPAEILVATEQAVAATMAEFGIDATAVAAIGLDAMISGTVGLGEDGSAVTAYTTTLDTRFAPYLQAMSTRFEGKIRRICGAGSPTIAAKAVWYRDSEPAKFEEVAKFVTAGGLVAGHLVGLRGDEAVIDPTVLWAFGLSDTKNGTWSAELCRDLEVPESLLPRIVPSTHVIGLLRESVARRMGLPPGVPVIAGCGDQMSGYVGVGIDRPGRVGDSAGTYSVVGRVTDSFGPDPGGWFDSAAGLTPDQWYQQSVLIGGGFTRSWCAHMLASAGDGMNTAVHLDKLADAADPGSDGVVFFPHLGGQNGPNRPEARGAWVGLNWDHGPQQLARAVLEALGSEIACVLDAMGGLSDSSEILSYGGGARSAVGTQIKADITGRVFASLGDVAPATVGAALLGAAGVGDLAIGEFDTWTRFPVVRRFEPDIARHARYLEYLDHYKHVGEVIGSLPGFHSTGGC